jgi:hypothetical protein
MLWRLGGRMTPVDAHRVKRPHSEASEENGQRNLGGKEGGRSS